MALKRPNGCKGRYGLDGLSNGLMALGIVSMLLSVLPYLEAFSWVALISMALALFRTCSKNFAQRRKENAVYERIMAKPKRAYALAKKKWVNRKTTLYFTCKNCGQALSVRAAKAPCAWSARNARRRSPRSRSHRALRETSKPARRRREWSRGTKAIARPLLH